MDPHHINHHLSPKPISHPTAKPTPLLPAIPPYSRPLSPISIITSLIQQPGQNHCHYQVAHAVTSSHCCTLFLQKPFQQRFQKVFIHSFSPPFCIHPFPNHSSSCRSSQRTIHPIFSHPFSPVILIICCSMPKQPSASHLLTYSILIHWLSSFLPRSL